MKSILIIPELQTIEESTQLARVENLGFEYDDFFLPRVMTDSRLAEQIAEEYCNHWLPDKTTLHGAFFDVTIFSSDPDIRSISRKRVEDSLRFAKRMNANAVIFHTNYLPTFRLPSYRQDWLTQNTQYWTELCLRNPNTAIYIENMFDLDPELLARLGENMKNIPNFGICLDYAHAALSDCPLNEWVEALAPYVKHLHINDNDLSNDLHLELGTGKIDWDEFVYLYFKHMNQASILLEMRGALQQKRSLEYLNERLIKYQR